MGYFQQSFANRIWTFIARISVWRPGSRTKNFTEWVSAITGAGLGIWGIVALFSGGDAVTGRDIDGINRRFDEVVERLDSGPTQGRGRGSADGLKADLDKAIKTLLASDRADALGDKTGAAADAALDALIAQRQAARELVARDEADLYRQKGAIASLTDTQKALAAYARATELDPDNPNGWNELALLQRRAGKSDAATSSLERLLALGDQSADQKLIAIASGNLGIIYSTRGDLDRAEAMQKKAFAIHEVLGSKAGMAGTYCNLGLIYWVRGDLDRAEAMYNMALAIDEVLGSKEGMARHYGNLGNIYQTRGDLDQAEAMYKKALTINEALGHKEGIAPQYGNLGIIYKERGNLDEAEAMYKMALAIDEGLGRKEGMAARYDNLGIIYFIRGDLDQAEAVFNKALAIDKALGSKGGMAMSYSNLGGLYRKRGEMALARTHWCKARKLFGEVGMRLQIEQVEGLLREADCPAT